MSIVVILFQRYVFVGESAGFSPVKRLKIKSIDEPIANISFPLCSSTPLKPLIPLEPVSTDDEIQIVHAHFPEILQPLVAQQPDVTVDDKQTKRKKVPKTPVKTAIQISSESSEDSLPDLMSSDGIHKAKKPIGVRYNAVFIVDLNEVDQKSIYADDNGVWNTASPRSYYRVDIRDGRIENVIPGNKSSYTHYLRRQYGTQQATYNERGVSFQRIISTATSKYNIKSRYAVDQYIHRDSEAGDIVMKEHGNAKDSQSRPFFKTDLSVLDNIKEETRETKPRQLFKKLVDDAGGPLYSSSASSEPRNLQQIYNIRSSTKAATKTDQLTHLVAQIRESTFVHELAADGESLQYVLASEKQLMDLDTFCTHQLHFSVFSVDSTFNIGNYYVTNTCFENLRVVHASGKYKGRHPLEMGPTFVHTHRDENSYLRFFSALDRMIPNFRYQMQAIGSDGDEATMNAIARDHIGFDSRLRDLKTTWDHLVPTFHAWFVSNESEKFKSHLIKAVTDQAQLDGHFSNNRVKSTNNNVKDWVGRSGISEIYSKRCLKKAEGLLQSQDSILKTPGFEGDERKSEKTKEGGRTPLDKSKPTLVEERRPMVQGSIQTTLDAIDHLDKAEEPFDIIYLFQTRAILCFGCGVKFNREKEQNELVVRHFCEREFTIHGVKKCKSQYAYFHFQVYLYKQKVSSFDKTQFTVATETKAILHQQVKDKLIGVGVKFE
ncbi:unnamed protein product [Mytilus coruscus]|uniref:Uncharacterized protein n=1 Tax=Mytilus coruscus TaxID=42192 RepID=A0A6J8D998_MYTCO|nr:unnamed protein product [Mytilus coruscus]